MTQSKDQPNPSKSARDSDFSDTASIWITDQPLNDMGSKAISGGVFLAIAQGAKFVFTLAGAMILARLLAPEDFGLVAMATSLMVILSFLKDAGLSTATIQKKDITNQQVSNLFWINVALGTVITIFGMLLAPAVAWFYGDSRLTLIMIAVSLGFFLTGSVVQHHALLMRHMRFKAIAIIEISAPFVGLLVASGCALSGFGYWSLVAMHLSIFGTTLVMTWFLSGWRPSLPRRGSGVRPMLFFGAHLTISSVMGRLASGSDEILIGRFSGAEALGFYTRAAALSFRPLEQLLSPSGSIVIPVMSRLQSDSVRYRNTFLHIHQAIAILSFMLMAPLTALAYPIILIVLGEGWEETVPLFIGLTVAAIYIPLNCSASWLFATQGRGRDWLRTSVYLSIATLAAYFVGIPFGPLGLVIAFSASGILIRLPIMFYLAGRDGPVSTADLWKSMFATLPCWIAAYVGTAAALAIVDEAAPLVQVALCLPVGIVMGSAAVLTLNRSRDTASNAFNLVRTEWRRRRAQPSADSGETQHQED